MRYQPKHDKKQPSIKERCLKRLNREKEYISFEIKAMEEDMAWNVYRLDSTIDEINKRLNEVGREMVKASNKIGLQLKEAFKENFNVDSVKR